MSATPATDLHTHLAPLLPEHEHETLGVRFVDHTYVIGGASIGPAALYEPDELLAHLRANWLDRAAVSVPPPFFRQGVSADDSARWATAVNDGLAAAVDGHQELLPLAYLPLDHPELARAEYLRRRNEPCWAGFVAAAGGGSAPLDEDVVHPLWRSMDADGALLLLHPGTSPDTRLRRHYLANLLGNPVETAVAAAELVFGDVPHRYPSVSFLLAHCGGAMPALTGRWQRGVDTARPGIAELGLPPAEAVRRFWVDSLAHDPAAVDLAVSVLGPDRIVLGSDWPFPMGAGDVHGTVAHLPVQWRERIARDNPAALLGVAGRAAKPEKESLR